MHRQADKVQPFGLTDLPPARDSLGRWTIWTPRSLVMQVSAHRAVWEEAADAGADDGTASSCGVAADAVHGS